MAKDKLRKPVYEIFSIKRKFWQSKSWLLKFNEACARERQKEVPINSGYFTDTGSSSVKTVADRHRHAAYHNKHRWQTF